MQPGRLVTLVMALHYAWITVVEVLLGVTAGDGRWSTGTGAVLLEYAQPHTGLHVLLTVGLFVAVLVPTKVRFWLLAIVVLAFLGVVGQALIDPQGAGEGLGHEGGMPLSYLLNDLVILALATVGTWQARPRKLPAQVPP